MRCPFVLRNINAEVFMTESYLLDKTQERKIGETTFIVSSFVRSDNSPDFLDILNDLIKKKLETNTLKN